VAIRAWASLDQLERFGFERNEGVPSSVIRKFSYDPEREELAILFTTGRRYIYRRVPSEEADAFRAAFSKGRFFNARIRDAYDFTEVLPEGCRHINGG
jgi:KTSC domain